jgi:hypothetical protein
MKPFPVIVGFLGVILALGGSLWLIGSTGQNRGGDAEAIAVAETAAKAAEKKVDDRPKIADQGPYPKVVTDETEHDFGTSEVGVEGSHEFVIKNEGEADLVLAKGPTTCKCTLSAVAEKPIPPGQSATVKLTWKPAPDMTSMRQTAEIYTNDPKRPGLSLIIHGKLQERLRVIPHKSWPVNDVLEGSEGKTTGYVVTSILDKFDIVSIEPSSSLVKVAKRELTEEEKKTHTAKIGYAFDISVAPTVPVGTFLYQLKIKTDQVSPPGKDGTPGEPIEYVLDLGGNRPGPIQIIGPGFRGESMAMTLGSFDATKGMTRSVNLFAQKCPEEGMRFTEVKADPPELKVTLEPAPTTPGQKTRRHILKFEYPAGAPRNNRRKDFNGGIIEAKTNHPDVPDIRLEVIFNAY